MKPTIISALQSIFGVENVLSTPAELMTYEYDPTIFRALPGAVVFPKTAEQLSVMVRLASREGIPYVARGAGSNLSGGSIPQPDGIVVAFSRHMHHILELDIPNRRAVVEPGVVNLTLKNALAPYGYTYAPDPASQKVSTMGGNVAENAGGPHCLKYGVTTNHVLGLEVVLPNGQIVTFGGKTEDPDGYDLVGLCVGSEGMLGLVTQIVVKIVPLAEAVKTMLVVFDTIRDSAEAVSAIIARGMIPAALELMDNATIRVVETNIKVGLPIDAGGILIIEVEELADGLDRQVEEIARICRANRAREVRIAQSETERERLWAGRRGAFAALTRLRPDCYICDGTVPRTRLPDVLDKVYAIADRYHLTIGTLLHAGDGNLHPNILFDARDPDEKKRVVEANVEIMKVCVEAGGTITGEHGVGIEKREDMAYLYSPQTLEAMRRVKRAFDPGELSNPGKVFPQVLRGA